MSWTKRQLVEQAFAEIGLRVATFNVRPEQLQAALMKLNAMMATWDGKGIRLGYAMTASPAGDDLDQESGLPDRAYEAVTLGLAIRMAPSYGKVLSQDTRNSARDAYEGLLAAAAFPAQQQLPRMPRGAGNKSWRYNQPFLPEPVDPLLAAEGSDQIEFD